MVRTEGRCARRDGPTVRAGAIRAPTPGAAFVTRYLAHDLQRATFFPSAPYEGNDPSLSLAAKRNHLAPRSIPWPPRKVLRLGLHEKSLATKDACSPSITIGHNHRNPTIQPRSDIFNVDADSSPSTLGSPACARRGQARGATEGESQAHNFSASATTRRPCPASRRPCESARRAQGKDNDRHCGPWAGREPHASAQAPPACHDSQQQCAGYYQQ